MAIHPTIIHPDLAFTRCITEHGQIVRETGKIGPCLECGDNCANTGWPGVRWTVRAYIHEDGKVVRLNGRHEVCHTCLIMWNE